MPSVAGTSTAVLTGSYRTTHRPEPRRSIAAVHGLGTFQAASSRRSNNALTENNFDSPSGRFLLIPQGARLVGIYDSQVAFGQSRVLLVWTRLIMPNGRSIILERQPAADTGDMRGFRTRSIIIGARYSRRGCCRPCLASGPSSALAPATVTVPSSMRFAAGQGTLLIRPASRSFDVTSTCSLP